jgi:hypothetical protein
MVAPLKVDDDADVLATHSAHFLYSETRRQDIEKGVREALGVLDGTLLTAVSVNSGLSPERIAALGGLE